MPLLKAVIISEDVHIIQSIAISRFGRQDTKGWHFTKHGKYTVKSGYKVETQYYDMGLREDFIGPTIKDLQAAVWTLKCPPKIQHFLWQMLTGCVSIMRNLRARGIKCDIQCGTCGADEETTTHVIFGCPPAIQTWALSKIPSNPESFPTSSLYGNLDYLLQNEKKNQVKGYFPWIIWYLWKNRNSRYYSNRDRNPQDTLILAETEGQTWDEAQTLEATCRKIPHTRVEPVQQDIWWCQVDGSWKSTDQFSGQGWVCTKRKGEYSMYGSRNIRRSQSPLHAELEALIWAMECMQGLQRLEVVFTTDCSDVVKMVSSPEEWPAFEVHLDELHRWMCDFQNFQIKYMLRDTNTIADSLARSARKLVSEMVYVDSTPPTGLLRVSY